MPRHTTRPIQIFRGGHDALSEYVGPIGEVMMDTTEGRLVVHDGKTPGGIPHARLDELSSSKFVVTGDDVDFDDYSSTPASLYVVGAATPMPDGAETPCWFWNFVTDDGNTVQWLLSDGSVYWRQYVSGDTTWGEWATLSGGSGGGTGDIVSGYTVLSSDIASGTQVDTASVGYHYGTKTLSVYYEGVKLIEGLNYNEVLPDEGTVATHIELLFDAEANCTLEFVAVGGENV